jgi:CxxC-x17-CxxC domain-containing protein
LLFWEPFPILQRTGDAASYRRRRYGTLGAPVIDKTLTCKDCGTQFEFTVRDQQFYAEKGFENEPQRCKSCRAQRKTSRSSGGTREMFEVVCAQCNVTTTVPFKPRGDRPIYCRECFAGTSAPVATT